MCTPCPWTADGKLEMYLAPITALLTCVRRGDVGKTAQLEANQTELQRCRIRTRPHAQLVLECGVQLLCRRVELQVE